MKLGEIIRPVKAERCGEREFLVLSIAMHDGIVLQSDRFKKTITSKDRHACKIAKQGQVVV